MAEITRRGFLRGLAALAVVAVAPSIPLAQVETERQRLMRLLESGRIVGETFYLDGPVAIKDVTNLIIHQCRFVFKGLATDQPAVLIEGCSGFSITSCIFDFTDHTNRPRSWLEWDWSVI